MATSNIVSSEIIAPLELLRGEIQDSVALTKVQNYPLLSSIRKESAFQTSIDWPVNIGTGDTYGRATSTAPSTNSTTDSNVQASLGIGSRVIEHKFSIDVTQATQALRIAPAALRNIYKGKINAGLDALMKQLELLAYVGDGSAASHGIVGLDKAISNVVTTTDIYAGLDASVYPGWSSYQNTNGTARSLTTDLMRDVVTGQAKKGGVYNLILTTFEVCDAMEKLFEPRLALNQAAGTFNLGFSGVTYQSREVKKTIYSPAKNIYLLNTEDVCLFTYALQPALNMMAGGASEVVDYNGLNVLLTRMPQVNPHSIDFILSIQPQLQVFNRRSIARLVNVQ